MSMFNGFWLRFVKILFMPLEPFKMPLKKTFWRKFNDATFIIHETNNESVLISSR